MAAFGTQTSAVCAQGLEIGGPPTNTSFEFDGSSWTAGNDANTSKGFIRGFGTLTAGATCGGTTPSAAQNTSAPTDFLSNGVKIKSSNNGWNQSGQTFIYMAFAEHPFVSSKGVPTTAR